MTATTSTIHINSELLALLGGSIIPLLVGLVTKMTASSGLKAVINGLLSAVAGAVTAATANGGTIVGWELFLLNIGLAWLSSIATYYGLYKPTGVAQRVQRATARFGLQLGADDGENTNVAPGGSA